MTLALLTLILVFHMKITGKTIPFLEKRLNKIKNSKKNSPLTEINGNEIKTINRNSIEGLDKKVSTPFKSYLHHNHINYSTNLKI